MKNDNIVNSGPKDHCEPYSPTSSTIMTLGKTLINAAKYIINYVSNITKLCHLFNWSRHWQIVTVVKKSAFNINVSFIYFQNNFTMVC